MDTKPELPALGYGPNDIPKMTGGAISRTRVFGDLKTGKLKGKKVGQRTLITPDEAKRYIDSFPDRETAA
jgi:hypothetical protein